jgi:hypothetical protein
MSTQEVRDQDCQPEYRYRKGTDGNSSETREPEIILPPSVSLVLSAWMIICSDELPGMEKILDLQILVKTIIQQEYIWEDDKCRKSTSNE